MRVLALLFLLLPLAASAQSTGTFMGQVTDVRGHGLSSARVRIEGTQLIATTDVSGRFRILGVPIGTYDVQPLYDGLGFPVIRSIPVGGGETIVLNVAMGQTLHCCEVDVLWEEPLRLMDPNPYAPRRVRAADLARLAYR